MTGKPADHVTHGDDLTPHGPHGSDQSGEAFGRPRFVTLAVQAVKGEYRPGIVRLVLGKLIDDGVKVSFAHSPALQAIQVQCLIDHIKHYQPVGGWGLKAGGGYP